MFRKRKLPNSQIALSEIGYGTMELRGSKIWFGRKYTQSEAYYLLDFILDIGINHFDTAPCYGQSETIIGDYLKHKRKKIFIATKVGSLCKKDSHGFVDVEFELDVDIAKQNFDKSLSSLKTDYVDILYLHSPTKTLDSYNEVLNWAEELITKGVVQELGISTSIKRTNDWLNSKISIFQFPYDFFNPVSSELTKALRKTGKVPVLNRLVNRGEPFLGQGSVVDWNLFNMLEMSELKSEKETNTGFLFRLNYFNSKKSIGLISSLSIEHIKDLMYSFELGQVERNIIEEISKRYSKYKKAHNLFKKEKVKGS